MKTLVCQQCGAELFPQTSFCRQCGAAVSTPVDALPSETDKAILQENTATRRLDSRPTSEQAPSSFIIPPTSRSTSNKGKTLAIVGLALALLVVGIVATIMVSRFRTARIEMSDSLVYPGARTVVDLVSEGGGRALQLETTDHIEKVDDWYRKALKPQKVLQLSTQSIVLKNEHTTVTIVSESGKTIVLIKTVS